MLKMGRHTYVSTVLHSYLTQSACCRMARVTRQKDIAWQLQLMIQNFGIIACCYMACGHEQYLYPKQLRVQRRYLERQRIRQLVRQDGDVIDGRLPAAAAAPRQLDGAHLNRRRQHRCPPVRVAKNTAFTHSSCLVPLRCNVAHDAEVTRSM